MTAALVLVALTIQPALASAPAPVPAWELAVEVARPGPLAETPLVAALPATPDLTLYVYDDAGDLVDTFDIDPSLHSPDWTADFDGGSDADWAEPSWASLGTAFLTLEFFHEGSSGDTPLGRYVYVPSASAYATAETNFFRPVADAGPVGVSFEVSNEDVQARPRHTSGSSYEDVFASSYVLPYNYDPYAAACSGSNCPASSPDFFLARLPVDGPLPTAANLAFTFAAEADALIPSTWGTVPWDVAGLALRFPAGRRLLVEGALDADGVTLTEAVTGEGWGGLVFRQGSGGVAGASALAGVVVEHVRRPPPQGGFAVPYGAVTVAGREVTLDDMEVVSSVGGITGLLVSGAADVAVTGISRIEQNDGGGVFASGGAHVTLTGDSFIQFNPGGAGVTASGYGTLVELGGATVSDNTGVGVESRLQATVLFASDETDPATTVENNLGGLDAGGGSQLVAGVCGPTSCGDRPEHFIVGNNPSDMYFDAQSLGGSYLNAQGNDWGVGHLDDLELVADGSSWLEVCPLVGAGGCGIDGRLAGGARRGNGEPGGGEPPLRLSDVLALVDEAERARMAGDEEAFAIAATAAVAAIDTSRAEDDRRAAFEVTARLFAWAQPAGPLAALEALAEAPGEGRPWALRALGVAHASAEAYEDARAVADTLAAGYAGGEHAAFGLGLSVRVAVAEDDEAAAVAALLALADTSPGADALGALAALVVGAFPEADLSALMGGEAAPAPQASATASGVPGALLVVESARPNPSSGSATVPFELADEAEVEAVLYDVLGRRVAVVASGPFAAGRHALTLEALHLPAGVYVVAVTARAGAAPAAVAVRRFTLTR